MRQMLISNGCSASKQMHLYKVLIFFHIPVFQEYLVLRESRIRLKLVLGGVRIVALSISSQEQTQSNRVCCFLVL